MNRFFLLGAILTGLSGSLYSQSWVDSTKVITYRTAADSTYSFEWLLVEQTPAGHILTVSDRKYKTEFGGSGLASDGVIVVSVERLDGTKVCRSSYSYGMNIARLVTMNKYRDDNRLLIAGAYKRMAMPLEERYGLSQDYGGYIGEINMSTCGLSTTIFFGRTYASDFESEKFNSISPTQDGGYLVAGLFSCDFIGTSNSQFKPCNLPNNGSLNDYSDTEWDDLVGRAGIIKLNASKQIEWVHVVNGGEFNGAMDAVEYDTDRYAFIGTSNRHPQSHVRLSTVDHESPYLVRVEHTGRTRIIGSQVWETNCEAISINGRTLSRISAQRLFRRPGGTLDFTLLSQQITSCTGSLDLQFGFPVLGGPITGFTGELRSATPHAQQPGEFLIVAQEWLGFMPVGLAQQSVKYGKSSYLSGGGRTFITSDFSNCYSSSQGTSAEACSYTTEAVDIAQTDFGTLVAFHAMTGSAPTPGIRLTYSSTYSSTDIPTYETAERYALDQNYPNPFNPSTQFRFRLDQTGPATLEVLTLTGQRVAIVHQGVLSAGDHVFTFDGHQLASGIYLYRLSTPTMVESRKMTLIK